jgi:transposase
MPKCVYSCFVGVDVSKSNLDLFVSKTNSSLSFLNHSSGINSLLKSISPTDDTLVLVDLTGGYDNLLVNTLYSKGFKVHRSQGRKVRLFISSYGQKAKSDKIDAKMIAIYGQKMQESLRLYKPNDTQLQELISRLQDIKNMLQKENNPKEHFFDKSAKQSIDSVIKVLQKQLDSIEQEINKRINNSQELKQKAKVISSVKSLGQKTTMTLLAALPELGFANRRQIAALAGLAPYANESGSCSKHPRTSLGRPIVYVRSCCY